MKRFLKKLSAVAIAAVMVVSLSIGLFAGCSKDYELSAFVFSSATDQVTNQTMIDAWAASYAEEHDLEPFEVNLTYESDTGNYFNRVSNLLSSGDLQDVFYVSPKQVRSYAVAGVTLDLTDYVDWEKYPVNDIYPDALKLYATDGETVGEEVTYTDGAFKTTDGKEMGVYALPKDFSSFGLAYNKNFFTNALREAYTTTPADGVYYANADGTASSREANFVNIGETVVYFPYNFFNYDSFDAALAANDPIAVMSNENGGYAVTILGWPGDTYDTGIDDKPETNYDESIGYVTYTYSEYSAMTYAVAYYVHSQRGSNNQYSTTVADGDLAWLNDTTTYGSTNYVYGNDQYEGPLYLTAWLLGNDVNIINDDYTSVDASQVWNEETRSYDANPNVTKTKDGAYTFNEGVDAYGINSEEFIEAYAAFLAYGSDWNNLSFYAGNDSETSDTRGGWACFSSGRLIFYGLGTWDLQTLNSTAVSKLQVGIMPEPVSEDFTAYARVKNGRYESQEYGDEIVTGGALNVYTEDSTLDTSSSAYSEWKAMQDARQDQWFARLDSVGYGVNADVLDRYTGDEAWKVDAMADLCAFLSCSEEVQSAFTYSGSQLSSLQGQCEDYVYYQEEDNADGAFSNMITSDGNAAGELDVTQAELTNANQWLNANMPEWVIDTADLKLEGEEVWYFAVAAANRLYTNRRTATTPAEYIQKNYPSLVDYLNPYFSTTRASQMDGVAYAYKVLNMVGFNYAERNIQVRMAAGVNGAADSCTFTYSSTWSDTTFSTTYKGNALIAYNVDKDPGAAAIVKYNNSTFTPASLVTIAVGNADGTGWDGNYYTPYAYCLSIVTAVQTDLQQNSLIAEINYINANK